MLTFLALVGFVGLIAMVVLILMDKTAPWATFVIVSAIVGLGLVAVDNYGRAKGPEFSVAKTLSEVEDKRWKDVAKKQKAIIKEEKDGKVKEKIDTDKIAFNIAALKIFVQDGLKGVVNTAALFIFSILFFTILSATGFFDRIIKSLLSLANDSIYVIMVVTVAVACVAHLDGSGASSFLIAIPALLPIYQRMNLRPTTLMLVLAVSMGVMNLLPWGGPTIRVANIISGVDSDELYAQMMPMQVVGLILSLALALYMGFLEKSRLVKLGLYPTPKAMPPQSGGVGGAGGVGAPQLESKEDKGLRRDNLFIANLVLIILVIAALFKSGLPSFLTFMVGSVLALLLNYPNIKLQDKMLKDASSAAMMMAATLLAAGVLIGVFEYTGIMKAMAKVVLDFMPPSFGNYLVLIVGILAVPMAVIFCTDSYFYGILPIVISVGAAFGIDAVTLGITMCVARNCGTFISPVVPATLLGCGLAGVSIRAHLKNSFFWVWAFSIICIFAGVFLGVIDLNPGQVAEVAA